MEENDSFIFLKYALLVTHAAEQKLNQASANLGLDTLFFFIVYDS